MYGNRFHALQLLQRVQVEENTDEFEKALSGPVGIGPSSS